MDTTIVYRVRVQFVGQAIERSLPYEFRSEHAAETLANTLNHAVEQLGYHHYAIAEPAKQEDKKKKGNYIPVTPERK